MAGFKAELHPRGPGGRFTKSWSKAMTPTDRLKAERTRAAFQAHELDAHTMSVFGGDRSVEQTAAVDRYAAGGWKAINADLREGKVDGPDIAHLDAATRPLPVDAVVHRVVPLSALGKVDPESLAGRKVKDATYAPASVHEPEVDGTAVVRQHISAPAGTPAFTIGDGGEVVLGRDMEMAIESVTPDGQGGYDMQLIALPKGRTRTATTAKKTAPPKQTEPPTIKKATSTKTAVDGEQAAKRAEKSAPGAEQSAKVPQWRADAAKPGRIAETTTKRQAYVASWETGIRATEAELAQAKANDDSHAVARLTKDLQYQTKARDAIANKQDPKLDETESAGGRLAQSVDPSRPLAVYGDMLHLDGEDDAWTYEVGSALEQIPAELHGVVADRMAAAPQGGIWVGEGGVSELDHAQDLAGEQPRGWAEGRTFEDVDGVYRPAQRAVLIGRTDNSRLRNAASHEFGHALDASLGHLSAEQDWHTIHGRVLAEADYRLSPYFRQAGQAGPQEFWAEAFRVWAEVRNLPAKRGEDAFLKAFGLPPGAADQILDYFGRIAAENGVVS